MQLNFYCCAVRMCTIEGLLKSQKIKQIKIDLKSRNRLHCRFNNKNVYSNFASSNNNIKAGGREN